VDTKQLLSEYHTAFDTNALHIYQSAAATMPVCPLWEGQACKAVVQACLRTPRAQGWIMHSLILEGHTNYVTSVAFSPDGQFIVSGSRDNTVRMWDTATGTERHTMHGHHDWVSSVSFSPNGQFIVSSSHDETVRVWDATTGTERHTMHGHQGTVNSVAFSPNGHSIVSGSDDKTVRVWDATTGTERHNMHGHHDWVWSVAFSPNGQSIASGSDDYAVRVWDATTGAERHIMHGHEDTVHSVAFSPDGYSIVSRSHDTVRVWNASTGMEQHTTPDPDPSPALAPRTVVAFEADTTTGWVSRIFSSGTRQSLCWLPPQYRGQKIAFHGQTVCIGADNGAITILDFSDVPFSYE
jgi:WD40 repeat protein